VRVTRARTIAEPTELARVGGNAATDTAVRAISDAPRATGRLRHGSFIPRQRHRPDRAGVLRPPTEHRISHGRGGYRDSDSHAFIESWLLKLKQRCIWHKEFETLEQARAARVPHGRAVRLFVETKG
jgi:hypothetical protein